MVELVWQLSSKVCELVLYSKNCLISANYTFRVLTVYGPRALYREVDIVPGCLSR